jgi:tetratricopeptide (TPR) repeat protein
MKIARHTLTLVLAAALGAPAARAAEPPTTPARRAFDLRMNGRSDDAEALLREALAGTPEDATAWFELARTEFYHFRFDDAAEAIARAIELAPDNARFHYVSGMIAVTNAVSMAHSAETRDGVEPEMGRSLAAFARAVEIDPAFHEARLQLVNMLVKTPAKHGGSRAEATEHVEMLESLDAVRGVEGRCMLIRGNEPSKIVKLWEQAVADHATRAEAHAGLAAALLYAGEIDRAVPHVDEALRLDPGRQALLLTLCRQCLSEDDPARAEQAVERYLAAAPPVPLRSYGTFCLAMLQRTQGNRERAEALLAEAKTLDPHCWTTYMEPAAMLFEAP